MAASAGTHVISWDQTEIDGLGRVAPDQISVGATWRWFGEALRLDGRGDLLLLENAADRAEVHRRAAAQIRRLLGAPRLSGPAEMRAEPDADEPLFRSGFTLTDGRRKYEATLVTLETGRYPMILFAGQMPPAGRETWVISATVGAELLAPPGEEPGTVCFVPGTLVSTPDGPRPVETLGEGDMVETRDSGPQPIRWVGRRHVTGARLRAMGCLRPIRIAAHVLSPDAPEPELVVSPDHRVLVRGPVAQELFGTPEVLVAARDLVNDSTIRPMRRCRSLDYVHLMLDRHQVVWANGVETESFHPAGTSLDHIPADQRAALLERFPDMLHDALSYGAPARRNLTRAEAALLIHGMSGGH